MTDNERLAAVVDQVIDEDHKFSPIPLYRMPMRFVLAILLCVFIGWGLSIAELVYIASVATPVKVQHGR